MDPKPGADAAGAGAGADADAVADAGAGAGADAGADGGAGAGAGAGASADARKSAPLAVRDDGPPPDRPFGSPGLFALVASAFVLIATFLLVTKQKPSLGAPLVPTIADLQAVHAGVRWSGGG